jgi:uncharacterized protein
MIETESFLLPLFQELRKQGVSLGIPEYLLAIKSIREGIGIEDINRLERFLKLIWTKSQDEQEIFNSKFTELVKHGLYQPIEIPQKSNEEKDNQYLKDNQIEKPAKTVTTTTTQQELNITARLSSQLSYNRILPKLTSTPVTYNLIPRLPISQREMTVCWRHMRRLQREGIPEDLDIQGTIDDICKVGFFRHPVLKPRRRNQVKLVLLIDREGSMSPFNPLMKVLQKSIEKGGVSGKISTYYFHDCPEVYLYKKPNFTEPFPIEDILLEQARDNSVLIVSDAGAARRTYDGQRLKETKAFIQQLRQYTYLYAWLNPVPQSRWRTTTAEDIAQFVPMYSLEREGLNDSIKILLGHPFPPGVRLDDQDA